MIILLRLLLRLLYGFRTFNEEITRISGPVLLLPNHVSWWDWLLLGVCLDDDWRFVTSKTTAELSWFHKRIMVNRRTFPVDVTSPYAVKHMAEFLLKGGRLVLFPEGRISHTGSLMKLFDGTGFLILKTRAKVITAYLRGAGRLPYSRNPNRKNWFPRISVHFSNLQPVPQPQGTSAIQARTEITHWLRDCLIEQQFAVEMKFGADTLPSALLESARQHASKVVLQDATLQKLTYRRLLTGVNVLASCWDRLIPGSEERVGVLLPNVNAMPTVMFSLWSSGKVPAILNYTAGTSIMLACARISGVRTCVTSRLFLKRARLDATPLEQGGVRLIYLEDVRDNVSTLRRMVKMLQQYPYPSLRVPKDLKPESSAFILFTSGSESDPKAVELTHRNILANIRQMVSVIDLVEPDRFFNALPLFHSFGLSVGLLLPLLRGVFVFLYVSPLHYRLVPAAFYDLSCTVFFGTNTFLNGYARKAHPYDFRTMRYLFAGAEKLQESTASLWMQKFGVRILEGYGATECSPCLSVNTPVRGCFGTAGRFLPGIEYRLEPVEGVTDAGRLFVRGPNLMKGYLNPAPNAAFQALGGWYDTGDIVQVDAEGFVHILGRLKRFAKVSGEMVSLTAVEEALAGAFPQYGLRLCTAIVSRLDEGKGEKLVAVTNEPKLTLEQIREVVRAKGLGNLAVPRELQVVREIPRLGSGKINHRALESLLQGKPEFHKSQEKTQRP